MSKIKEKMEKLRARKKSAPEAIKTEIKKTEASLEKTDESLPIGLLISLAAFTLVGFNYVKNKNRPDSN